MDFKNIIDNQIKESMLNKSKTRLIALRAIKSAILLEEKSGGSIEKNPVKLLMKLIKQRKDSRDLYQKENRIDLAEKESNEIKIIEEFLPEQMSDVDLEKKIEEIIKEEGGASMKDMGRIMGIAVKMLDGKADNSRISIFVKKLLA
ncbi:MAG: GatB/YqeY domain-containing protein [Bacteroidota bacterium]|nr:GatB/YqeY domain-containing protein [Bacteroidota bacterium]